MLSTAIKNKVEDKYGSKIKYPVECDALAQDVSRVTGRSISSSTIKRLWGFIEGATTARSYTLDTVAEYCGSSSFDDLIKSFDPNMDKSKTELTKLTAAELDNDAILEFRIGESENVQIQRDENQLFTVVSCNCESLDVGQTISFSETEVGFPLFIKCHGQGSTASLILGKLSGVTALKIIPADSSSTN